MSIFKASFDDYIKNQIYARQNIVDTQGKRPIDFQLYVSAKSPWIKMTSLVDYNGSNDLSKRYVLMGGTLWKDPSDDKSFDLRSGILGLKSSYGTDLGSSKIGAGNLQYGIRPMPGITSVDVKSKSAYGSLREAVVKFYAWDVKQLEDLLVLFMRPGYPVLLEWGWSMYLDTSIVPNEDSNAPSVKNPKIKSFDGKTINCFEANISQETIYSELKKYQKKFAGNYDGVLGLVRNYETSMLPNGGFECTTTLISIGDVIDTLRMNTENGDLSDLNSASTTGTTPQIYFKDEFELLLTGYQQPKSLSYSKYFIDIIDAAAKDIPGIDTDIYFAATPLPVKSADGKTIANDGDPLSMHYMQFAYFIHILNNQKNLYSGKQKAIIDIEIPLDKIPSNQGNGLCISSYNAMTIDNNTCIIKNSNAKIISEKDGFKPKVIYADPVVHPGQTTSDPTASNSMKEYLYVGDNNKQTNLGVIGNIYVNIGKLLEIYKSEHMNNNGFIYLGRYIKRILREMEFALGSINSFDIYVNDNKTVIIDKHYVEDPSKTSYDSKFQINVLGTNTIVRHQKIVSKIFPSQATMIAIAAQSTSNIASLQSSTYTYMNKNITSRIFKNVTETSSFDLDEAAKAENIFQKNLRALVEYVSTYIVQFTSNINSVNNISAINTFLNNFLVKIDKGTEYKAIVPVSLELTMDGIGGIVIGQIFTINKDILPKEFSDKKVGFIVTGISQNITRPDWITTLQTQFCLLDQESKQEEVRASSDSLLNAYARGISVRANSNRISVRMYNILASFVVDYFNGRFKYDINTSKLTYKSGIRRKQLALTMSQSEYVVIVDGKQLTLEDVLDEMSNTFFKEVRDTKHYSAPQILKIISDFNDRTEISSVSDFKYVSDFDPHIIRQNKFYSSASPVYINEDVKNTFNKEYDKLVNDLSKDIHTIIDPNTGDYFVGMFRLLVESRSINAFGRYEEKESNFTSDGILFVLRTNYQNSKYQVGYPIHTPKK